MSDDFKGIEFRKLLDIIREEYNSHGSVFGISSFHKSKDKIHVLGPAAGPHTQLAQNIIVSYLTGARFIELKTVQIMDYLGRDHMISKPCIDARDEGFNVEWSTEFTLTNAFDEYIKAYFAIHYIQHLLGSQIGSKDFTFNMSVGYTLDGIKQRRMQKYINSLMDASDTPQFKNYSLILKEFCGRKVNVSPKICESVTISTMHGCPPEEIRSICRYMITRKHLNTYVKLNPTLLGYENVSEILSKTGFGYVKLKKESFEKDLQYPAAVDMIKELMSLAKRRKLLFGVKLTNTLGNINDNSLLSGDERYMSGRALLPISLKIASKLSDQFKGKLPISYSGGVNAFTVEDIYRTGIRPLTLATDILKPGGYNRMNQMAGMIEKITPPEKIDTDSLRVLADSIADREYAKKSFRGFGKAKVHDSLPLFDCYAAPCVQACPVNQNIPDYVNSVSNKKYSQASGIISQSNMLVGMTCVLCDQKCKSVCSRIDYEGPIEIKSAKKEAFTKSDYKVAVIGAGPAGLAAAHYLIQGGYKVHVFEKQSQAGGVVANLIPDFRIDKNYVRKDVEKIMGEGAVFHFNTDPLSVSVSSLKNQGFKTLFYAIGCEKDNKIEIPGTSGNVYGAIEFLNLCRESETIPSIGKNVVVLGGGNTAMDIARTAIRKCSAENVTIVYRRSQNEMSADKDEVNEALNDGVKFIYLANAHSYSNGKLKCTVMKLGEPGADGRRTVSPTDELFELDCDTVITALGMHADPEIMKKLEIDIDDDSVYRIGDMSSGPSTIVRCMRSARDAVSSFTEGQKINKNSPQYMEMLMQRRNNVYTVTNKKSHSRCLDCSFLCNKCVDVCPNRANVAIYTGDSRLFEDNYQILHLDSYCNECGNCAVFCEHEGKPYKDKITYFENEKSFNNSENKGFYFKGKEIIFRCDDDEINRMEELVEIILSDYSYLL